MSFSFEYRYDVKNDQDPPPHKRQRVLPEGTDGPLGPVGSSSSSSSSRNETPRNHSVNPGTISTRSMPPPLALPIDSGPIFTHVDDLVDGCCSVESVLGVPAQILFRQVGGGREAQSGRGRRRRRRRRHPLLARQEMEQFLRLTLLAQEIDVLVDLSESVLSRRRFARRFRRDILMQRPSGAPGSSTPDSDRNIPVPWKNPWLITLGPILDVLEQRQPQRSPLRRPSSEHWQLDPLYKILSHPEHHTPRQDVLQHVHEQMTRLCHELQECGVYEMERSAEQNRSLVASLTDFVGSDDDNDNDNIDDNIDNDNDNDNIDRGEGHSDGEKKTCRVSAVLILAREKQALSKLQYHLSKRVRSLLTSLCFSPVSTTRESRSRSSGSSGDGDMVHRSGKDDENENENDKGSKQILFDDHLSSSSTLVRTGGSGKESNKNANERASTNPRGFDGIDDEDDESSLMSLEETMTPLVVICEQLFKGVDFNSMAVPSTPSAKESNEIDGLDKEASPQTRSDQRQRQQQSNTERLRSGNKFAASSRSCEKNEGATNETRINHSMEASQRTAGAAVAMMTLLATGTEKASPINDEPSKRNTQRNLFGSEGTRNQPASIGIGDSANMPRQKRYSGIHDDDGSFVEDPPSDGEEGRNDENGSKRHGVTRNKNSTATTSMGIFDVVDVLTPCSESGQPREEPQQGCNEGKHNRSDNADEHISSLSSQSSQTAAEALTRMVRGNR